MQADRVHRSGLDEHIGSHLTLSEMQELRRMLIQLADALSAVRADGQQLQA